MLDHILVMREIAWKLAEQTLVFADWAGFREMALPGDRPGGLLRWCARMATSVGLLDSVWWLPYLGAGLLLGAALRFAAFGPGRRGGWRSFAVSAAAGLAAAFGPLALLADRAWGLSESASPLFNAFGLAVACATYASLRPLARRRFGLVAAAAVCAALVVPFGLYPLLGGAALVVRAAFGAWRGRARDGAGAEGGGRRAAALPLGAAAALGLLVLAVPAAARFVYDDLSPLLALGSSHALRLDLRPSGKLRAHLQMLRCARRADWAGVLAAAERSHRRGQEFPLRMEIAYRILAQFWLGRLPEDLFRLPVRTSHADTDADQHVLDGYELLLHYGLPLPARRSAYESANEFGWRPEHYRALGDAALIMDEKALASRNYRLLGRCPFRGEFASRRLRALLDQNGTGAEDLAPAAELAQCWQKFSRVDGREVFRLLRRVEKNIYEMVRTFREAPEPLARLLVSVMLLDGDWDALAGNAGVLDGLYPPPCQWPAPVQEALVAHAATLSPAEASAFLARFRPGAISDETHVRFRKFVALLESLGPSPGAKQSAPLRRAFGDTYFFYEAWVHPREARTKGAKTDEAIVK